jgi:hypothetical protein
MVANRNGFFTLDRLTGELLVGRPHGHQVGAPDRQGRQTDRSQSGVVRPAVPRRPRRACLTCAGHDSSPPSFDPSLQLFFVMARETCA